MAGADLSEGVVVMSGDQGIAGKIEELKDKAEAIGEKLIAEGKEAAAACRMASTVARARAWVGCLRGRCEDGFMF